LSMGITATKLNALKIIPMNENKKN
jgi:hypothetical protein